MHRIPGFLFSSGIQYGSTLDVRDFGADTTDTNDATSTINAALAASNAFAGTVFVGPGTYRINGTIVVGANQKLLLDPAAVLHRHSSVTTGPWGGAPPLVALQGNYAKVTGPGLIQCDGPCPYGVVQSGPSTLDNGTNDVLLRDLGSGQDPGARGRRNIHNWSDPNQSDYDHDVRCRTCERCGRSDRRLR